MQLKYLIYIILLSSLLQFNLLRADISVLNGKKMIALPDGTKLFLKSYNHRTIYDGALGTWNNKIIIRKDKKIIREIVSPTKQDIESLHHYFLPLEKNKYFVDLNKDGTFEIAVLATNFGNAWYYDVNVYSFKGKDLIFYKKGQYPEANGEFVVFHCGECSKLNRSGCSDCL